MHYSEFSLVGEISRYLNISCILSARILREAVDGIDKILEVVNKYNEVINDILIPHIFHALYDVESEQKTEDRELILLRESKDFCKEKEIYLQKYVIVSGISFCME